MAPADYHPMPVISPLLGVWRAVAAPPPLPLEVEADLVAPLYTRITSLMAAHISVICLSLIARAAHRRQLAHAAHAGQPCRAARPGLGDRDVSAGTGGDAAAHTAMAPALPGDRHHVGRRQQHAVHRVLRHCRRRIHPRGRDRGGARHHRGPCLAQRGHAAVRRRPAWHLAAAGDGGRAAAWPLVLGSFR